MFMYVQCKMYAQLFQKWKQFNRVIYINDIQIADLEASRMAQMDADGTSADDIVIIHMDSDPPPENAASNTIISSDSK